MTIDNKIHERLKELNSELTVIEKQIHATAVRLDTALQYELKNGIEGLLDYDLSADIACYNGKEDSEPLCILHESLYGVSTLEKLEYIIGDSINHNVLNMLDCMKGEHHCWLFHCLYDHTNLTWEQISSIQTFWIDIKPWYQYQYEPNWNHKTIKGTS